jgi:hypothetical protein
MHASTSTTALYQLVVYLTRPLTKVYPAQTVAQLQLFLHTNLASQFLTSDPPTLFPFTLLLSPASLPPTPLYAACLQSGITWPQWIRVLGGQPMSICVMQDNIKVRVGHVGDANASAITIWSGSDEPTHIPAISKMSMKTQNQLKAGSDYSSPMTRKLQAILDSVRSRNASSSAAGGAGADKQQPKSIALPTLLLPTTNHADADTDTDSDDISDSESDTESTSSSSSSSFSETSSTESMTSLSSSSSSPVSKPSDLPAVPTKKGPVYIPRHRLTTRPTTSSSPFSSSPSSAITTQQLSRSQRRIANATVDTTKVDLCRYTYQGGQTCVMTGGVMLGAVKPKLQSSALARGSGSNTTATTTTTTTTTNANAKRIQPAVLTKKEKKSSVMLGPDSSRNWRVRV